MSDGFKRLFGEVMRVAVGLAGPQPGKPSRFKQRPEDIDRALAEERISRTVRQNRPKHAPPAQERPERRRSNAAETFSIVKEKQRRRKANTARKGIAPRPTAQMGWNPDTNAMIREVLCGAKKDEPA